MFPAWKWVTDPAHQFLCVSHAEKLAIRDTLAMRRLITSEWYKQLFSPTWTLTSDQNEKKRFENSVRGWRIAAGLGAGVTGDGGDTIIIDDPLDRDQAFSEAERANAIDAIDQKIVTRLNDPANGAIVLIMQRLHEDDPAGHLLKQGGWEHLTIPMEYENESRSKTSLGFTDPRTESGELMWPDRFPRQTVDELKVSLGSIGTAGQLQQNPAPAEGVIFNPTWWRYEKPPDEFDEVIQSWDLAFKDTKTSDFVAGGVFGRKGSEVWVLDILNERLSFSGTCDAIVRMSAKWPQSSRKLVEDKANGPAVIDALKSKVSGLVPVDPEGGKVARAYAVQPFIEAGNVRLPLSHPLTDSLVHQCKMFPLGANDDMVDMMTQAILRLCVKKKRTWDF